ncbi:MAG: hypothetical protein ACI909_003197 [Planctomycetota bacterium]|jgi:hypothetical protein
MSKNIKLSIGIDITAALFTSPAPAHADVSLGYNSYNGI